MRIWDINPGYLNNQSLLGEHRELHGIVSILSHNKKGYARHPETLRWKGFGWALRQRHRILQAEMKLRGFMENSPVYLRSRKNQWPSKYIDSPCGQFEILSRKYEAKTSGRIPLPGNIMELWSHHKYSVMARNLSRYKDIGSMIAKTKKLQHYCELTQEIIGILRQPPSPGMIKNVLQHMWGYVSKYSSKTQNELDAWKSYKLLVEIQYLAKTYHTQYLLHSTALSELAAWL